MLARPYVSVDAKGCDVLTRRQGITTPGLDEIFVCGEVGHPTGILVYRDAAYVHELECGADLRAPLRADALANYAVARARSKGLLSAVFLIKAGNERMRKWVDSIGAVEQTLPGDSLWLLTPP
jgi:hypothetical protein